MVEIGSKFALPFALEPAGQERGFQDRAQVHPCSASRSAILAPHDLESPSPAQPVQEPCQNKRIIF